MNTIPATHINEISIAGRVAEPSYDQIHNKLAFTLENSNGRFSVEFQPCTTEIGLPQGTRVMVNGSIYSLRSERYRLKIRARSIRTLSDEYIAS
jgi:RNase P/RNase MRP subunit p29